MKVVLQRVAGASVTVDGETIASIGRGLLLLVGVADGDDEAESRRIAGKCAEMRIFSDDGSSSDSGSSGDSASSSTSSDNGKSAARSDSSKDSASKTKASVDSEVHPVRRPRPAPDQHAGRNLQGQRLLQHR